MPDLLYGLDGQIAGWVASRIPHVIGGFGRCRAIGVGYRGLVIAGFVYSNWHPRAGTIEIGLAADSPKWATRRIIHQLLRYPFEICECQRVTLVTSQDNGRALKLALGLGFVQEAIIERGYGRTENAVVLRMFEEDWRAGPYGRIADDEQQGFRTDPARS